MKIEFFLCELRKWHVWFLAPKGKKGYVFGWLGEGREEVIYDYFFEIAQHLPAYAIPFLLSPGLN